MRILGFLALFLGLVALAPASHAAPVNLAVSFTATGFGTGAPADPVTGSFHATFDTTGIYVEDPNVITNFHINNITIPSGAGDVLFSYAPILGATIGGPALSSFFVQKGADDFRLVISLLGNAFTYSQVGVNKRFST